MRFFLSCVSVAVMAVIILSAPASAACVSPAGQSSHPVFKTVTGLQICADGDNWSDVIINGTVPTGAIMAFAATSCPAGWTEYAAARGRFLRGIDNGAGNDPGGTRVPGNTQADAFQGHIHSTPNVLGNVSASWNVSGGGGAFYTGPSPYNTGAPLSDGTNGTPRIADETRPKNVAVLFCQYQGGAPLTATPSGAAGAIQFSDGAGGLSSNPGLVWDEANGRLGVNGITAAKSYVAKVYRAGGVGAGLIALNNDNGVRDLPDTTVTFTLTHAATVLFSGTFAGYCYGSSPTNSFMVLHLSLNGAKKTQNLGTGYYCGVHIHWSEELPAGAYTAKLRYRTAMDSGSLLNNHPAGNDWMNRELIVTVLGNQ